jgi:hypothetical protein
MLLWHRKAIILKGEHETINRFTDVRDGGLPAFALRNATWKAGTLRYPKAVFAGINEYLSHNGRIPVVSKSSTQLPLSQLPHD